jgi:hypothetical protein
MIVHPPRLFRRDAWKVVGRHDEQLTNAIDCNPLIRFSEIGSMHHVRKILYSYRILRTSTSWAKEGAQTRSTLLVVQRLLKRQGKSDHQVHIPNPEYPRRISIHDRRFAQAED